MSSESNTQSNTQSKSKVDFSIKKLPKSELEISITVPPEILDSARKRATEEISKDVKVKGFRPGHVPAEVLKEHIDPKYIEARAQELAVQRAYAEVIIQEKLEVVSRPKVEIKENEPLKFIATVTVMPEVELKDHKSIKVPKQEIKLEDKDIQAVIEDMLKYGTTYKDAERASQKGDRVEVDFEGFDQDGVSLEGTKSTNHPVILGDGVMIPGFEDELIGLKKEETKEFDITFPKDYGKKDFQNKKVKFKTTIRRIEEPQKPEFNEDLIEKMTGKKQSTDDFKKEVEVNLKDKKERDAKQERENKYIEELLKKTKVEVPDALIDEESEYILMEMKEDIEKRGIVFEKYLETAKTNKDELIQKYRPEAERRIRIRLALQKLISEEEISVSDAELQAEVDKIIANYP
ncbi:trigger factor, partial [Candidatus Peregrinibacteria bacterium]|nr:trigger factor [Candidatus Peregrinibacteria bacterium]